MFIFFFCHARPCAVPSYPPHEGEGRHAKRDGVGVTPSRLATLADLPPQGEVKILRISSDLNFKQPLSFPRSLFTAPSHHQFPLTSKRQRSRGPERRLAHTAFVASFSEASTLRRSSTAS